MSGDFEMPLRVERAREMDVDCHGLGSRQTDRTEHDFEIEDMIADPVRGPSSTALERGALGSNSNSAGLGLFATLQEACVNDWFHPCIRDYLTILKSFSVVNESAFPSARAAVSKEYRRISLRRVIASALLLLSEEEFDEKFVDTAENTLQTCVESYLKNHGDDCTPFYHGEQFNRPDLPTLASVYAEFHTDDSRNEFGSFSSWTVFEVQLISFFMRRLHDIDFRLRMFDKRQDASTTFSKQFPDTVSSLPGCEDIKIVVDACRCCWGEHFVYTLMPSASMMGVRFATRGRRPRVLKTVQAFPVDYETEVSRINAPSLRRFGTFNLSKFQLI